MITHDWSSQFYVDLVTVDADQSCPTTHPEEVIYDIWPGTTLACDCLDHKNREKYELHQKCKRSGKTADHPLCKDVSAKAPIIQNKIKNFKFCAQLGDSYFDSTVQPIQVDEGTWSCAEGYQPCDEDSIASQDINTLSRVICV